MGKNGKNKGKKANFVPYSNEAVETISQKKLQEQESAKTQGQGDTSSSKKLGKLRDNKKGVSPSVTTVKPDCTDLKPAKKEQEVEVQANEYQNNNTQMTKEPIENNSPKSSKNNVSDVTQHISAEFKNISEETSHENDIKSKDTLVKATNSTNTESPTRSSKPHPDNPAWIINSRSQPTKHPFGSTLNPNASEFKPTSNSVDQREMDLTQKSAKTLNKKQSVPQDNEVTNQNITKGFSEDLHELSLTGKASDTNDNTDEKTSRDCTQEHKNWKRISNKAHPSNEKHISSEQTPNQSGLSVDYKNSTSEWNTEPSTDDSITNATLSDQHDDRYGRHNEERGDKRHSERIYNNDHQTRPSEDRRRNQEKEFSYRGRGRNNQERNLTHNSGFRHNKDVENISSTYQSTPRSYDDSNDRSNNYYSKRGTDRNQTPNNFRGNNKGHNEFGPRGNSRYNPNRYKDGHYFEGGSKFDDEGNRARRIDNNDRRVSNVDNTRTDHRYEYPRNENKRFPRGHNSNSERGRNNPRGRYNPAGRNNFYSSRRQSSDVEITTDDSSKDSSSNYHITDEGSSDVPERKGDLVDDSWDTDYPNDSANKQNEAVSNKIASVPVESVETSQGQTWETSGGNQDDAAWNWNDEVSEAISQQNAIAEPVNDTTQENIVQTNSVVEVGVPSEPRKQYEDDLSKLQANAAMPKYEKPRRSYEPRDPKMERDKLNKSAPDWRTGMSSDAGGSDQNFKQTRMTSFYANKDPNREKSDKEYDLWEYEWRNIKDYRVVKEIQGDLFQQPKDYSLAHCVAEDLRMGSGIAVDFKREFKNVPDLLDQRAKQGGLATLPDTENKRFVYYLVTKRESTGKPTYLSLWKSLNKMKKHIIENEVKKLAVPRLGCGLDRLEWNRVKSMMEYLFRDIDLDITVCNFQQEEDSPKKLPTTCKYVFNESPINKIESGTLIFYFSTEAGNEDTIMTQMSKKFNYLPKFRNTKPKRLGDIIYSEDGKYGLCGCIVRRTVKDPISFKSLWTCVQEFNRMNKKFNKEAFEYVAFQWVNQRDYMDDSINEKIITVLINCLRYVEVHACRGDFKDDEKQ